MRIIRCLLLTLSLLVTSSAIHGATITWTNTLGGDWGNSTNWSPNQVPTNTDNVLITAPGTYKVNFNVGVPGYNTTVGNLTIGGTGAGVRSLAITNASIGASMLMITNGGVLIANYTFLNGTNLVVNGGSLLTEGEVIVVNGGIIIPISVNLTVRITNGGVFTALGTTFNRPITVGNGGRFNESEIRINAGASLAIQQGGVMNLQEPQFSLMSLFCPMTNSGTINLTNSVLGIYNPGPFNGDKGGLVNEPGGVINLHSNSTIVSFAGTGGHFGYFTNRGVLNQLAGADNSISVQFIDMTQAKVTNRAGILTLSTFRDTLGGTYHADAGTTIKLAGTNNAPLMVLGTPFAVSGPGKVQFVMGHLSLPTTAPSGLELLGTSLQVGPGFQGGAITNLAVHGIAFTNTLPVTGSLSARGGTIAGDFTIASGGSLTATNVTLSGLVPVAAGGRLNLFGPLTLLKSLTNAGTLNITNGTLGIGTNAVVNQPGGAVHFWGEGDILANAGNNPSLFINRGTLTKNATAGTTSTVAVATFDTTQGLVTNLSGILELRVLRTALAGNFHTAAGATTRLASDTNTLISTGVPLSFTGSGQNEIVNGFILLSASIPNLAFLGGKLILGPGFQGGAITNLTLGNVTLTNTLPVMGRLNATNSLIYGDFTIGNGGQFAVNDSRVYAPMRIASGGLLNYFGVDFFDYLDFYGPVTVAGGGVMNLGGFTYVFAPLTNSGTINMTNGAMFLANDGVNGLGGIVNLPAGVINFWGESGISSYFASTNDYILNQGNITKRLGPDSSGLTASIGTNFGTITIQTGEMFLRNFALQPSSVLNIRLNSAVDYGSFQSRPFNPMGTLNVTLNGGYVPTAGTEFRVMVYTNHTGTFNTINLPGSVTWNTTYGSTNLLLTVVAGGLQFVSPSRSGTNLVVGGSGGTPGVQYRILSSTNAAAPLASWTPVATNTFNGSGEFFFTNRIVSGRSREFFILRVP